jgi:thiol-disulfide isomerase/thioredoxin
MLAIALVVATAAQASAGAAAASPPDANAAEARVVEYLQAHVHAGEPVVVSKLYNEVFTAPGERAALNRLFNTFFKIPLFVVQHQRSAGRPPSLDEISGQFHFLAPGEAALMLRIMESDPRVPRFLTRDPGTGEITHVDSEAILADPRFGKALERTITGLEGRPAPAFSVERFDGKTLGTADLAGRPHLVYFWFTGCPPCQRTSPLLAELERAYRPRGFEVVALNADRALDLPIGDEERSAYAQKVGDAFTLAHASPEALQAWGGISVFPTMFFVDRKGTVVRQLVNFQDKAALEDAIRSTLD